MKEQPICPLCKSTDITTTNVKYKDPTLECNACGYKSPSSTLDKNTQENISDIIASLIDDFLTMHEICDPSTGEVIPNLSAKSQMYDKIKQEPIKLNSIVLFFTKRLVLGKSELDIEPTIQSYHFQLYQLMNIQYPAQTRHDRTFYQLYTQYQTELALYDIKHDDCMQLVAQYLQQDIYGIESFKK